MAQFASEPSVTVAGGPDYQDLPTSAQLAGGGHVVVWNVQSYDGASGRTVYTPYAQVYDAHGDAVEGPLALFRGIDGTYGAVATGVGALADGSFVVAASANLFSSSSEPPHNDVYTERFSASGQAMGDTTLVRSATPSDAGSLMSGRVLAAPDGGYYVEMNVQSRPIPLSSPYGKELQRYDPNGQPVGQSFPAGYGIVPPVETLMPDGNILVAGNYGPYPESGLFIAMEAPDGSTITSHKVTRTGLDDSYGSVASLGNGQGLVVWHHSASSGTPSVLAQVVDGSGNFIGPIYTLDLPAGAGLHLTSLAGGGALVWWNTSGDGDPATYPNRPWDGQYIDTSGQLAGDPFFIGNNVASVTATSGGGFYVESTPYVEGSSKDIQEQKFDAAAGSGGNLPGRIEVSGGVTAIRAGNFTISGTAGIDQIAFAGAHASYVVTQTSVSGPEGADTISGIERVRFGDGYGIALDVGGHAGEAYRLYQAAFDRVPDLPGLGYQMNDLDQGHSLSWVAGNFIASPEFQANYGSAVDNSEFITLLYQHVLKRNPEAAGLQFHLDEFAHGESRADMLAHFSESPENQANVIGQIENGMLYVAMI